MPIKIRAADARNNFAEILGRAHFGGETFLIEKQGKPFAVVLGIEEYQRLLGASPEDSEDPGKPESQRRNGHPG